MPDANSFPDFTVLSVDDVKAIIAEAKRGAADPASIAMQIFAAMGDKVTVSGATLRDALSSCAVSLDGPLENVVGTILDLSKMETSSASITGRKCNLSSMESRFGSSCKRSSRWPNRAVFRGLTLSRESRCTSSFGLTCKAFS